MEAAGDAPLASECAAHDLDLLEGSICDLVVAIGGTVKVQHGSHQQQLQAGDGITGFQGKTGSQRLRTFRKVFEELDVSIPAFMRVLHLHLRRGAALLRHCPEYLDADASHQANNRASGDAAYFQGERPIVTSLKTVSGLSHDSLLDIVEGRTVPIGSDLLEKIPNSSRFSSHDVDLFCRCYLDPVMDLYEGVLKRVCTFDVYDCIRLRCFFVNLDHILSLNGVRDVRIRNEIFALILKQLRFALRNAWWIRTETEWLRSKLPFMCEQGSERKYGILRLRELREALDGVSLVSGQHGALDVRLFRAVVRVFDLKHEENDMWKQLMGGLDDDEEPYDEYVMFKKVVGETKQGWDDVIMAALVTIVNTLLFESFVHHIGAKPLPESVVDAVERLEMLYELVELLHETDFGYTAWAVDILGTRADATLINAFRIHGDLLLKGCGASNVVPLKRSEWGEGVLVYGGTLKRINIIFRNLVTTLVDRIAAPALEVIANHRGLKLWWELLYSDDKLLIGPRGEVGNVLKGCNTVVRDAVCVELFARIIAAFASKVGRGRYDAEQIIFNALSIWESFCSLNLGPADIYSDYHINVLFEALEKIKMGVKVKPDEILAYLNDFWKNLLSNAAGSVRSAPPIYLLHYIMREMEGCVGPENRAWIGGHLRKRVALFGNVVLLFRDDSSLQPSGMVDMQDVVGVYSLDSNLQATAHMSMSESDAELYSCGTTDSDSDSPRNVRVPQHFDSSLLRWGWALRLKVGGKVTGGTKHGLKSYEKYAKPIDLEFTGPEHREIWLRSLTALTDPRHGSFKWAWWPRHSIVLA
ncbi:uncharacterized protein BXIN_0411 [Babesia sp. Xinjiang]|uniref:uncharacterized protein n=1 Tax=Babesia sp. Xinjiang TaxID=462227 RepID=UPI000A25A5C1|nr:uncharacterized protein BXIN_0411 [Babesia sp. Xinjiang]ORM41078.1 hypothetical protein BXIN_0411 [Babesia sp. Xinjiang]